MAENQIMGIKQKILIGALVLGALHWLTHSAIVTNMGFNANGPIYLVLVGGITYIIVRMTLDK